MATTQQLLDEAKEARHKLVTQKLARVFVDQNGERVEFTATRLSDLDEYIRSLEALISPATMPRRPLGFIF